MVIPPYLLWRIGALVLAILVYLFLSNQPAEHRKTTINHFINLSITLFVSLFGAKFVTNASLLLESPMALLVYPSGTPELYIALGITTVQALYIMRKEENKDILLQGLVMIALFTLFFFDFSRVIFVEGPVNASLFIWFLFIVVMLFKPQFILEYASVAMLLFVLTSLFWMTPDLMGMRVHVYFYLFGFMFFKGVISIKNKIVDKGSM
ncbi:hypothetical protein EQV77_07125 [Halobacillus fulvus]|nr:hypothetical protein EQV77_07125 [Halobacillus fulvus]